MFSPFIIIVYSSNICVRYINLSIKLSMSGIRTNPDILRSIHMREEQILILTQILRQIITPRQQ